MLLDGAAIHRVQVRSVDEEWVDVHLFLPSLDDYRDRARNPYLGATCGRVANRIAGARFALDGRLVEVDANEGPNQLHGGPDGFDRRPWEVTEAADDGVVLALRSDDGDQGFPGALAVTCRYEVDGAALTIAYEAEVSGAPTVVNLTSHGYWNLAGVGDDGVGPRVDDHVLRVPGERHLPVGPDLIPTAPPDAPLDQQLAPVAGTPLDLRAARRLGDVFAERPSGLDGSTEVPTGVGDAGGDLVLAAVLDHPPSGRRLEVRTDQPAIQLYTGGGLPDPFLPLSAVCLEAQRWPDAPNRPALAPIRLAPGELYQSTTILRFTAGDRSTPPTS